MHTCTHTHTRAHAHTRSNKDAVTDELVELIYRPSVDPGARDVFVSVITGGRVSVITVAMITVELIYRPSVDPGARDVFVSVITGGRRRCCRSNVRTTPLTGLGAAICRWVARS